MAMPLSGLASSMDTKLLIEQMMIVEAQPQVLLKNQVAATTSRVADLQTLNKTVAALAETAKKHTDPTALQSFKGVSSNPSATVTIGAGAAPGEIDVVVSQTAQAQTSVTGSMKTWPDNPPVLTFVGQDGKQTTVTAASDSLDDVAKAINNNAAAGVKATKVASGKDADGATTYRLQLTSANTGAAGEFSVYRGDAAAVTAGTATNVLTETGAATTRVARDAEVKLWAGTDAEQTITSASNEFKDLLPGVNVKVSAVSTEPINVSVTADTEATNANAKAFVDAITAVFGVINIKTQTSKITTDGVETTKLGTLTGDSLVRTVKQDILNAASAPIDGVSPGEYGITLTKGGTLEFEPEKFAAAMAANPAKVEAFMTKLAARVNVVAENLSNKNTGQITTKITGQESMVKNLNTQVESWELRLSKRTATLQATFVAMEVAMSKANSTSDYLKSQMDGLSNSNSSK